MHRQVFSTASLFYCRASRDFSHALPAHDTTKRAAAHYTRITLMSRLRRDSARLDIRCIVFSSLAITVIILPFGFKQGRDSNAFESRIFAASCFHQRAAGAFQAAFAAPRYRPHYRLHVAGARRRRAYKRFRALYSAATIDVRQ